MQPSHTSYQNLEANREKGTHLIEPNASSVRLSGGNETSWDLGRWVTLIWTAAEMNLLPKLLSKQWPNESWNNQHRMKRFEWSAEWRKYVHFFSYQSSIRNQTEGEFRSHPCISKYHRVRGNRESEERKQDWERVRARPRETKTYFSHLNTQSKGRKGSISDFLLLPVQPREWGGES